MNITAKTYVLKGISLYLLVIIIPNVYVRKPHAIPKLILNVKIIIKIVIKTDDTMTKLFQFIWSTSITRKCCIPTITNAPVVTLVVNKLNTNGAKKIDSMNNIPVTIVANPVLAPTVIPVPLSVYDVTVLVPIILPIIVPIPSAKNALSIPLPCPSSSTKPHCLPNTSRLPVVSNKSTNKALNTITIKLIGFANKPPKPFKNPPTTLKSKFVLIIVDGTVGINPLVSKKPNATIINPIIDVNTILINMAKGTFLKCKINVNIILINAKNVDGNNRLPISTPLSALNRIIPPLLKPMNATKKPIPIHIAIFKSLGMVSNNCSLNPLMVMIK